MRSIVFPNHTGVTVLTLCACLLSPAAAQDQAKRSAAGTHTFTRIIHPADTLIVLPHQFIIAGSATVRLDSSLLDPSRDYLLDARFGRVKLLNTASADSTAAHLLTVRYSFLPFAFKERYAHREPQPFVDTSTGARMTVARASAPFSIDDVFGSNLQKSGSILRGFTVGSNQDLSLNSGFRMQMSGSLTNDLQLVAALTDENSPIQPEGTTQTLQEVDNVFIELRGSRMAATLGDFTLNVEGNEFGRVHRKLKGGKGFVNYGTRSFGGDITVAGASTKGKFTTNEFQGLDGVQGPYLLSGRDGERTMIVIAGTEKVYVNGELMSRGEQADYIIDYANAEITFRQRKLISRVSRITVDFEYSDRQYPRSLLGGKGGASFLNNAIAVHATIMRENDDETSPIDATLSQADKDTLAAAGGDPSKAVRSGVVYVGPGLGQYLAVDTVYFSPQEGDTVRETLYRYAPDSASQAVYTVTFSAVGQGVGSYTKLSTYVYQYAGRKNGAYEPIRKLPIPQSTALADVDVAVRLSDDLSFTGEYAGSRFTANKFSPSSGVDGSSNNLSFRYAPERLRIGGADLGGLDLRFNRRFIGSSFVPLDRVNEIEFNRKWNAFDSVAGDQELLEGSVAYRPVTAMTLGGEAGSLKHGGGSLSKRYSGNVSYNEPGAPGAGYVIDVVNGNAPALSQRSEWIRQRAHAEDTIGIFLPALRYEGERLLNTSTADGTLQQGTFRFREIAPALAMKVSQGVALAAGVSWRWDDSTKAGALQRVSSTFDQGYHFAGRDGALVSSNVDVEVRKRSFTPQFTYGGESDITTILSRLQGRYAPFHGGVETDLYYEASTERSARLERVFQHVPKGTGNYVYAGDLNNNHLSDPEEFVLSRFDADYILLTFPTDELLPVVNLRASGRLRLNGAILVPRATWLGEALAALSTETYLRVEEKSTAPDMKDIYLLHLSKFLNDETTLNGMNLVTQDVYIRESDPDFSVRFRYQQRNGLNKYDVANERTYAREQALRLRCRLVDEIANESVFSLKVDNLSSQQPTANVRAVRGGDFTTRFSYKFERNVELSFGFELGASTNFDTTSADINAEAIEVVLALTERAQARFDFSREEVLLTDAPPVVPYELTNGKVAGHTWLWKGSVDYRFGQYVQASLAYDGRSENAASPVHTVQATVRAFF